MYFTKPKQRFSIFELTSAKNSAGTIPIKVEISDGSIRVSKEFNFKPKIKEALHLITGICRSNKDYFSRHVK